MTLFKPLSYVVELEAAGVSRQQAQVHAQALQQVYHEEHRQYATKADLLQVSATLEAKISTEIAGVKTLIADCKKDFIEFRADVSSLKTSNKYLIWIGGGIATLSASASAIAMCLSMFLCSLK
jgi:hypothetical protein